MTPPSAAPSRDLVALADARGVATRYADWRGEPRVPPVSTIRAVLAAMGVDASDDRATAASLARVTDDAWRRLVAPTAVVRAGVDLAVTLTVPEGAPVEAVAVTASGVRHALALDPVTAGLREERMQGGERLARRVARVPAAVEIGTHRLEVRAGERCEEVPLLVAPARCPTPAQRSWGWQVQLYALRSRTSWGFGDFGDLRRLVEHAGELGAGLVLLNPLHSTAPVLPQEPSPYYPGSRRFTNPLYLRVTDCDGIEGIEGIGGEAGRRLDGLTRAGQALVAGDRIDRDAVFAVKQEALELLAAVPLPPARAERFAAYRDREGQGLIDLATFAALAERHGRSFHGWPAALRDPRGAAVASARRELADRVALHTWLQWQCDEQLGRAAEASQAGGMPVGLVTDLAVGVDPGGSDAWALQADLAQDVTVGAPPDSFNQRGQDWRLPPLRPDRLPLTAYAPFRDLVRSQLHHAGGLRIDHAMGLFRLFWIPEGCSPAEGTYVSYPALDLLGVLALEAEAAGAVVVGEDLGTVEPGVPEALRDRGVMGSRVLWFERTEPDDEHPDSVPLPSAEYPELALTSVSTHDLPTARGFLADEPARVRARLDLLGHPEADERARTAAQRADLRTLLTGEGLLDDGADDEAVTEAMHAFVARTPSKLVVASIWDAVGDLRQPNLPGTVDEYPNWRLPVAEPVPEVEAVDDLLPPSRPLLLEQLLAHPGVSRLAEVLGAGRATSAGRPTPIRSGPD